MKYGLTGLLKAAAIAGGSALAAVNSGCAYEAQRGDISFDSGARGTTIGPLFMRDSDSGASQYARLDFLFEGRPNGSVPPSNLIIMTDLRGTNEIGDFRISGKSYLDMLKHGEIHCKLYTSKEDFDRWAKDRSVWKLVRSYLPAGKYPIKFVDREELQTTDPFKYIVNEQPPKAVYDSALAKPLVYVGKE